ncbi:MAG: uroporphyrinogen-III synthase [Flavobacteriia bacterium]|nr:uroporphyrinogen-III synthase [Flavobacteriia bacterium]
MEDLEDFSKFCMDQNIKLFGKSFIEFSPTSNRLRTPCDVYFFSSKKGFDYFIQNQVIERNKKIACLGKETKNHIESFGYCVDFYSVSAGNPVKVSIEFKEWLNDRRVAFILSQISLKSISKEIPSTQKEELILYHTQIQNHKIEEKFEMYVFTSPSNVRGFLLSNELPASAKIIAWGKSTEKTLQATTNNKIITLKESTFDELKKVILFDFYLDI